MTLRAFVGASQTFNTLLFDRDYVNSKKSHNLNIFCLSIVPFDCYHKAKSACLSRKDSTTNASLLDCGTRDRGKGNTGHVNVILLVLREYWVTDISEQ